MKKGGLPALLVTGNKTFSDIQESGSQRKLSVVRPDPLGIMPDLTFEAPTCLQGFKFYSTRQGGFPKNAAAAFVQ